MKNIRAVRSCTRFALLPLLLLGTMTASAFAQSGRAEVRPSTYHDVSPPLRDLPPGLRVYGILEAEPVRRIPSSRNPTFGPDPLLATSNAAPIRLAPAPLRNFDGIGQGFTGPAGTFTVNSAPPDTNAAVGPNHVVETVNTDLAVFNKAGTPIFGPVPINTLVVRIRRRVPDQQRRRPDRRPTTASPTAGSSRSSRSPRRRSSSASPSRKPPIPPAPTPLLVHLRRRVSRLPEDGRVAGRVLHHLQPVQQRRHLVSRAPRCAPSTARRC